MKKLAMGWVLFCISAIGNATMLEITEDVYILEAGEYTYDYVDITGTGKLHLEGDVTIICNGTNSGYFYCGGNGVYGAGSFALYATGEIIVTAPIIVEDELNMSSGGSFGCDPTTVVGSTINVGGTPINLPVMTVMTGGTLPSPEPATIGLLGLGMLALRNKKRRL